MLVNNDGLIDTVLCDCDCGSSIPTINKKNQLARFKHGHHIGKGDKNPSWKGGIVKQGFGYIYERCVGHPRATKKAFYVLQHILVYEKFHNCCVLPWTHIHHIDGNRENNKIENLMALSASQHSSLTNTKDMSNRVCSSCGSNKTWVDKRGYAFWRLNNDNEIICNTCYCKNRKMNK